MREWMLDIVSRTNGIVWVILLKITKIFMITGQRDNSKGWAHSSHVGNLSLIPGTSIHRTGCTLQYLLGLKTKNKILSIRHIIGVSKFLAIKILNSIKLFQGNNLIWTQKVCISTFNLAFYV